MGDLAEMISPGKYGDPFAVTELYDAEGNSIPSAPHPSQIFWARVPFLTHVGDIMRSGDTEA